MTAADDRRTGLEALIWPRVSPGRQEHGPDAGRRAVGAILAAADAYAMARADERVGRMDAGELRARLRLAGATAEAAAGSGS